MSSDSIFVASGTTVRDVDSLCKKHDQAAFQKAFGDFFLLQRGAYDTDDRPTWGRFATVSIEEEDYHRVVGGPQDDDKIYHVPYIGTAPFPDWVTIGRAGTNIITIKHGSISKMHAFFKKESADTFTLYDARSKNGTCVNAESAPRFGGIEKLTVRSGDRVQFGSTHFLFLASSALWARLKDR